MSKAARNLVVAMVPVLSVGLLPAGAMAEKAGKEKAAKPAAKAAAKADGDVGAVLDALFHLSSFLAEIGKAYCEAGADFITIHDMGGSAGFVGPSVYEKFVFLAEKDLIGKLPKPSVLSVCGRMDKLIHLLAQRGADAVSVDQTTDIKSAREALGNVMLFGNLDRIETLYRGDETDITEAIHGAKEAGVDAVWPGCDLVPATPIRNIARMTSE